MQQHASATANYAAEVRSWHTQVQQIQEHHAKEDEEPVAEPVDGGASAETVDEQAVRLGVLTGSGISIPDMHGLVKGKPKPGRQRRFIVVAAVA